MSKFICIFIALAMCTVTQQAPSHRDSFTRWLRTRVFLEELRQVEEEDKCPECGVNEERCFSHEEDPGVLNLESKKWHVTLDLYNMGPEEWRCSDVSCITDDNEGMEWASIDDMIGRGYDCLVADIDDDEDNGACYTQQMVNDICPHLNWDDM